MRIILRQLALTDIPACMAINRSLPAWFGLEEGLAEAEGYLRNHRGCVAEIADQVVGYLTWEQLFESSAEISWMAVEASHHRRGVGRALVEWLEQEIQGTNLLSVKTLASTHPSEEYARTRAFYRSVGFIDQMVFPDLWDSSNPCLLMVKALPAET